MALVAPGLEESPQSIADLLGRLVGETCAKSVLALCERVEIAPGEVLTEQSSSSDDVYFVESGAGSVDIEGDGAPAQDMRLSTIGRGAVVGEVTFYVGRRRSATIRAEEPMVAWRFRREMLEKLEKSAPAAAISFHRGMAAMMSERIARTNSLVRYLAG